MRVLRWGKPAEVLAEIPGFLPLLLMPTLIIHGSHDPAIPETFARRAFNMIPNASIVTLEAGHFIPLNQPEPVASRLAGFFGSHSFVERNAACA
jgi:pimeloyl-ACP methyl ester carboxylesterase